MLEIVSVSLLLGAVSGFLAGLLGIGGGLIIVPALISLFSMQSIIRKVLEWTIRFHWYLP